MKSNLILEEKINLNYLYYNYYSINVLSILINIICIPLVSFLIFPLSFIVLLFPFIDNYYYEFCKYLVNGYDLFINYNEIIDNLFILDDKINKDKLYKFFVNLSSILLSYYKYRELGSELEDKDIINIFNNIDSDKVIKLIEIIERNIIDLNYNINLKIWLDSIYSEFIGGIYD